jgi:hypothetical protein
MDSDSGKNIQVNIEGGYEYLTGDSEERAAETSDAPSPTGSD